MRNAGKGDKSVMSPVSFACEETLKGSPSHIANQILDLSRWPQFQGYGENDNQIVTAWNA